MGTETIGLDYDLVCTQEKGQAPATPTKMTALELQISKPKEKQAVLKMLPKAASEPAPAQSTLKASHSPWQGDSPGSAGWVGKEARADSGQTNTSHSKQAGGPWSQHWIWTTRPTLFLPRTSRGNTSDKDHPDPKVAELLFRPLSTYFNQGICLGAIKLSHGIPIGEAYKLKIG